MKKILILLGLVVYAHSSFAISASMVLKCETQLTKPQPLKKLVSRVFAAELDQNISPTVRFQSRDFEISDFQKLRDSLSRFDVQTKLVGISVGHGKGHIDLEIQGLGRNVLQAVLELGNPSSIQSNAENGEIVWLATQLEADQTPELAKLSGEELDAAVRLKIADLSWSARTTNALTHENIVYLGDLTLLSRGDLIRLSNIGRYSIREIERGLEQRGLQLGMKLPGWPPEDLKPQP